MAKTEPGQLVPDMIRNALSMMLVSRRLMTLLEQNASGAVEYLGFTLLNHKGRVAEEVYVVNVLGVVDCADSQRTVGVPDPMFPGEFQFLDALIVDESRIDPGVNILRPSVSPSTIMMRDDLVNTIITLGMTGVDVIRQGEALD